MNFPILYEDQDIVVINKPPGVVVNRATSVKQATVQDWFVEHYAQLPFPDDWSSMLPADFDDSFGQPLDIWQERQGLVHRLDKDTSGVLLLAKHPGSLIHLLAQFKQRHTHKSYLALVHGHITPANGQIKAPLVRSPHHRLKFMVQSDGREAVTDYVVQQSYGGLSDATLAQITDQTHSKLKKVQELYAAGFSLVALQPQTGRTHQIRVHLSAAHHPLVADHLYSGKKRAKYDQIWCQRQFLHASQLEFTHPRTREKMSVPASLSDDLERVLELLEI